MCSDAASARRVHQQTPFSNRANDASQCISAGPLRFGIEVEDLLAPHESRSWNPLIANVYYRQGIIESWGSGALQMIELSQSTGIPAPEFVATPRSFTVRFRPSAYHAPSRVETNLSMLQQEILNTLAKSGPVPLRQLLGLLPEGNPERTVQNNLQILRALGLVDYSGNTRSARWSLQRTVV
jgi:ATP-dependent DNA helicase RecG